MSKRYMFRLSSRQGEALESLAAAAQARSPAAFADWAREHDGLLEAKLPGALAELRRVLAIAESDRLRTECEKPPAPAGAGGDGG